MVTWVAFCLWAQAAENFVFFLSCFQSGCCQSTSTTQQVKGQFIPILAGFYFPSLPFFEKGGVRFQGP